MINIRKKISVVSLVLILCLPVWALEKEPDLQAASAILYDYTTGRVLFEKNADLVLAPASMTKLVTLYLGWQSIEEGRAFRDELVEITEEGSSFSRPPGSSLMLLEEGQNVTFLEILKGLAISSGNDAAYALAHRLSGSEEEFVREMNKLVQSMGYTHMFFEDPDGWSSENRVTAREYAQFSADYIRTFPDALEEIHKQQYFVYPKEENLPLSGARIITARTKKNTNILLGVIHGVDGLKTGYIDESGFNFTATAKRKNSRYIAVIMGIKNIPYFEGISLRAEEAAELLEYGFRNFKTIYPDIPSIDDIKVWEGQNDIIPVELTGIPEFTLSLEEIGSIQTIVNVPEELTAPLEKGEVIGSVIYKSLGIELESFPIIVSQSIEKANIFKVFRHKIVKQYRKLFIDQ